MTTTRFDLVAYEAVQYNRVAELLQRLSNECSAAAATLCQGNAGWGTVAVEIENCAKAVRVLTGEREKPFRAT